MSRSPARGSSRATACERRGTWTATGLGSAYHARLGTDAPPTPRRAASGVINLRTRGLSGVNSLQNLSGVLNSSGDGGWVALGDVNGDGIGTWAPTRSSQRHPCRNRPSAWRRSATAWARSFSVHGVHEHFAERAEPGHRAGEAKLRFARVPAEYFQFSGRHQ